MDERQTGKACGKIDRDSMLYDGKAPQRIKELREARGLSQRKLAIESGVDSTLVSQVEAGNRKLSRNAAEKIGNMLEVGSAWLLYGIEEKRDNPVNDEMIDYLREHEELRRELWKRIKRIRNC